MYKKLGLIGGVAVLVGAMFMWRHGQMPQKHTLTFDCSQLEKYENIIPLAIIGSGPAGLSAALYGARAKVHTVVFEGKQPGGQLTKTTLVENWPGVGTLMGPDIMQTVRQQATHFGALMAQDTVNSIDCSTWPFVLTTADGYTIHALALVLATGANPVLLKVPGEDFYWGGDRGVTACAICDAPFYQDKDVVVVGGGDSACEEALQLSPYAKSVTMLVRRDVMRASASMQDRVKNDPKISIRFSTYVKEIRGDQKHVTDITVVAEGKEEVMQVQGVFLAAGHTPNSWLVKNAVACDNVGYIILDDRSQKTSVAGIFAAGDVADSKYRQAGIAAGDGIKAALDVADFFREIGFSDTKAATLQSRYFNPARVVKKRALTPLESPEAFEKEVLASEIPVVVDFYGDRCPQCTQIVPILEELAGMFEGKVHFVKVHALKLNALASKYEVAGVPTLLVFDKGAVVGRAHGVMGKKDLYYLVENVTKASE